MIRLLLFPDPTEGGQPPETGGASALPGGASPAPLAAATPPAANIVVHAERSEREVELQAELEAERERHAKTAADKKSREVKVSELEDELQRLRNPATAPGPVEDAPLFPTILDL